MIYWIGVYDGSQHPAPHPYASETAETEREARKIAARMLGHTSLRGASSWDRYQGGTVYQFGPRNESNDYDFVVIEAEGGAQ